MKVIVFSDVHGNGDTLERMLQQEQPSEADVCIFCGDMLGYSYSEVSVLKLLKSIPRLYSVQGNHDYYYANMNLVVGKTKLLEQYGGSSDTCKGDVVDYILSLPSHLEFELENRIIFLFHGSMEDYREGRIYSESELEETEYDYVFGGHSHCQMSAQVGRTHYVNPGSLGQPRDGKGFSYCVMELKDGERDTIEFKTVI